MANVAGLVASLTRPQVQEQAGDSSGVPPGYKGRIELDPTLLDVGRLVAALETGVFELSNMRVHQNLLLHHVGRSVSRAKHDGSLRSLEMNQNPNRDCQVKVREK